MSNINTMFSDSQLEFLDSYFLYVTKCLFEREIGTSKMTVDKQKKVDKLHKEGDWHFVGVRDMGKRGAAKCELGHALRYVYIARNSEDNSELLFGSTCVTDFFKVSEAEKRVFVKMRDLMTKDKEYILGLLSKGITVDDLKDLGMFGKILFANATDSVLSDSYMNLLLKGFFANSLPIPKSFADLVNPNISKLDMCTLGIDIDMLDYLKSSKITLIRDMFSFSEIDILTNIDNLETHNSDYCNFRRLDDLESAMPLWVKREKLLLKMHSYFREELKHGWRELLMYMVENRCNASADVHKGVKFLWLFGVHSKISSSHGRNKTYSTFGACSQVLLPEFVREYDSIMQFVASKEFYMAVKEVDDCISELDRIEKERLEKNHKEIQFFKDNCDKDECKDIYTMIVAKDIVDRCGTFDIMSDKQAYVVRRVIKSMRNALNKSKKYEETYNATVSSEIVSNDVNITYMLSERVDVLAKIQRLQGEETTPLLTSIMENVIKYKKVSSKQLKCIEDGYKRYILKEEVSNSVSDDKFVSNKKLLKEHKDVERKIEEIMCSSMYGSVSLRDRTILENVKRYGRFTDKQEYVINRLFDRL